MKRSVDLIHALVESTAIHVLASWCGLFLAMVFGGKGLGGGVVVEWIVAISFPFIVAGVIVYRQERNWPFFVAPSGAMLALGFQALVISSYMGHPFSQVRQAWPVLMFAVFSVVGVVVASRLDKNRSTQSRENAG